MTRLEPLKLGPSFREKIWGSTDLAPVFGKTAEPIGEAWYTHEQNTVVGGPLAGRTIVSLLEEYGCRLMGAGRRTDGGSGAAKGPRFPILTKLLFPAQELSVQVHPDDAYAFAHENGPGKTEMWYVLAAKPGARIALGLVEDLPPDALIRAARSSAIEKYLRWVPVAAGQTVFVPPGTLHALGAGVVICEIQQNSDITYRLYDFGRVDGGGRPRPLHVDRAAQVADVRLRPSSAAAEASTAGGVCRVERLARCRYFAGERLSWDAGFEYRPDPQRVHILIVVEGSGSLNRTPFQPGDCFLIPAEAAPFPVAGRGVRAIRAFVP